MITIISFLITISILVFIHELGHYYVARKCGVQVLEFSLGFGKRIFKWQDKEGTIWQICILPFGGFVKMLGDQGPASNPDHDTLAHLSEKEKHKTFAYQPVLNRIFIAAAGPIANYILAIIILSGFYLYYGKQEIPAVIEGVVLDMPAKKAGLLPGDNIISINNKKVRNFQDLALQISLYPNQSLEIKYERNKVVTNTAIFTQAKEVLDDRGKVVTTIGVIGITASDKIIKQNYNIRQSVTASIEDAWNISVTSLVALKQIIMGTRPVSELRGTLTIAEQSGKSITGGLSEFLLYLAMLSINLGLINLLPIPVLDGGHIVFYIYEAIIGKRLNIKLQEFAYRIGFGIIIFLFVISTSNDIKALLF